MMVLECTVTTFFLMIIFSQDQIECRVLVHPNLVLRILGGFLVIFVVPVLYCTVNKGRSKCSIIRPYLKEEKMVFNFISSLNNILRSDSKTEFIRVMASLSLMTGINVTQPFKT